MPQHLVILLTLKFSLCLLLLIQGVHVLDVKKVPTSKEKIESLKQTRTVELAFLENSNKFKQNWWFSGYKKLWINTTKSQLNSKLLFQFCFSVFCNQNNWCWFKGVEHGDEFWQHECSLTELNESLKKLKSHRRTIVAFAVL